MNSVAHRQIMSRYYALHSRIYDVTRWAFLFGRAAILDDLALRPGETVVEVGCGTGRNFRNILRRIGPHGRIIAVDCSEPMLERCWRRIRSNRWKNVHLTDQEYGSYTVTAGHAGVVLFSYSLSMIPRWKEALICAHQELDAGGRIGLVDFCLPQQPTKSAAAFARWMACNHVQLDHPYLEELNSRFSSIVSRVAPAFGGLWSFYRFVGRKKLTVGVEHEEVR